MTTASTYDLQLRAGDDHTFVVTWTPGGAVADLSGAAAEMTIAWDEVRQRTILPGGGTSYDITAAGSVEFTSADGEIAIDESTGEITVYLDSASTDLLPVGHSNYQLRVTTSDTAKTTIASGKVTVSRNLIDA